MSFDGRYRRYWFEAVCLAILAGAAFVFSTISIIGLGVLGGLHAINVDHTWWPFVAAGWGVGAIAAFAGACVLRRLGKTIRWFDYDADTVRYECVGSRRIYRYGRSDVGKISRYQRGGLTEWTIVFGDKKWARLSARVENSEQLINALIGDLPKTNLATRLVSGTIFEKRPDFAPGEAVPGADEK